jgi:hypothetical protein
MSAGLITLRRLCGTFLLPNMLTKLYLEGSLEWLQLLLKRYGSAFNQSRTRFSVSS